MNTEKLIELLFNREPGDLLKVIDRTRGREISHWFRTSPKGGRIVFHRRAENGTEEGMSQSGMKQLFKRFNWQLS